MASLGKAIEIAARVHANRVFGQGHQPYVLHCLSVMHHVHTEPQRIVAVLHAAVEELSVSVEELQGEGFAREVLEALRVLTRRAGESPVECARRVCANPLARAVRLSDMATHMNEDHAGGASMDAATLLEYSEVKAILISGGGTLSGSEHLPQ